VLNDAQKEQISVALEGSISAMSDEQVEEQLQGQPQEIVDEVVRINADARDRALGLALIAVAIIGLVGLLAAMLLPPDRAPTAAEPAAPSG
jgi:hypothetical protein